MIYFKNVIIYNFYLTLNIFLIKYVDQLYINLINFI